MMSEPEVCGVLNVHKQGGVTSRDVVNVVQRLVRPAKCGHAGTLDPLASGVLLVCVGAATRLISLLSDADKTYRAEFRLGQSSDTDDSTGRITDHSGNGVPPVTADLQRILAEMQGTVLQRPPDFSAVHVAGRRAYDLARRGETPDLKPREVRIDQIRLLAYDWPRVDLEIDCGSGTYIRSIARDLGVRLGCGGLMSGLIRTRIGRFSLDQAVGSEQLTAETVRLHLQPSNCITAGLPQVLVSRDDRRRLERGQSLPVAAAGLSETGGIGQSGLIQPVTGDAAVARGGSARVALRDEETGALLGLAELSACGRQLLPKVVLIRPSHDP